MTVSQSAFTDSFSSRSQLNSVSPEWVINAETKAIAAKAIDMVFQSRSQSFQALKDVDLEVQTGEVRLLMGPTGSGKTTLLSILAGILTPTAGHVHVFGQDIRAMSRAKLTEFRLQNIGFVFQEFNLFRGLTAAENVEMALGLKGIYGIAAQRQARFLLEQVHLEDKADRLPRDLSGGQQQRVAIARALAGNPRLILADEPTASLDSKTGHIVVEMMHQLAKERHSTVIIVTHDHRIKDIADRVSYLEDGQLR